MSKRTGLWVLVVAIVAIAGGGLYYWFEGRKAHEDFLAALAARGLTYEKIEENESGTMTFVNPKLDVGLAEPVALGSVTAAKTQAGYDLTLEHLEMPLFPGEGKFAIARTEIKALEFADKIDQTENGLVTAAILAPFLHDKAQSIHMEGVEMVRLIESDPIKLLPTLTIGEMLLENIEGGKVTSWSNKEIAFAINIDSDGQAFEASLLPNLMAAKTDQGKIQDLNLKRALEFIFMAGEDPEAEFEEIYSALEVDNYQLYQSDGGQTIYRTMRFSPGKMRAAKKAPAAVIQDFLAILQENFAQEIGWHKDPRVPMLIDDTIALTNMIGEQESVAEGLFQKYMILGSEPLTMTTAKIETRLLPDRFDMSYHDTSIITSMIKVQIGKIALEDFAYMRMLDGLQTFLHDALSVNAGEMEEKELAFSVLGLIPQFGQFSIEDFRLAGAQSSPIKEQIGEWSVEHIRLTNGYDFEQAVIPTAIEFEIKDLAVPAHIYRQIAEQAKPFDVLTCLLEGKNHVHMNYKIKTQWDEATQSLNFSDIIYGSNIVGTVAMSAQLSKIPPEFFSLTPLMTEEEYQDIRFKNLDVTYDPQGQETAFFVCAGRVWDLGGEDVSHVRKVFSRAITEGSSSMAAFIMQPQLMTMGNALLRFMAAGGKLTLSVKAKQEEGLRLDRLASGINPFDVFHIDLQHIP